MIYTGEVGNGGHDQYFFNRGTDRLMDTVSALEQVSLTDLSHILEKASQFAAGQLVEQEDEVALTELDALDRAAWKEMADIDRVLQRFLEKNQAQVLQPERGLIE